MLAHLGAYLGPMLGHRGGLCQVILGHIVRHVCWNAPIAQKMSIMPVRAARITDTTLGKHMVFAFRDPFATTKIFDLPSPQSTVKHAT